MALVVPMATNAPVHGGATAGSVFRMPDPSAYTAFRVFLTPADLAGFTVDDLQVAIDYLEPQTGAEWETSGAITPDAQDNGVLLFHPGLSAGISSAQLRLVTPHDTDTASLTMTLVLY